MLCLNKDVWGLNLIAFINALFFMTVTLPIWGILAAILVVAALGVGVLVLILKIGFLLFAIVNSFFHFVEIADPIDGILGRFFASLIGDFVSTMIRMWDWGTSVPDWMWNFARYDHPWWAFIIAFFLLSFLLPSES